MHVSEQISAHGIKFEQKNKTDFLIFHNIESHIRHNVELMRWPLHITIVPPFELENGLDDVQKLRCILREVADAFRPALVQPKEDVMFGPNNNRPATRVEDRSNQLHALHNRFLWDLGSIGCASIDISYAGERFNPHFTWQRGVFTRDQPFICNSLSIAMRQASTKQMIDTQLLFD